MAKRYYSKRYTRKRGTKYLVGGLFLIFIMLVVVSAYSDIPQLEPIRKQLKISFISSIPQQKPTYHCDSPENAAFYIYNCVDSTVILDTYLHTIYLTVFSQSF
jgi:hypothetical protein